MSEPILRNGWHFYWEVGVDWDGVAKVGHWCAVNFELRRTIGSATDPLPTEADCVAEKDRLFSMVCDLVDRHVAEGCPAP